MIDWIFVFSLIFNFLFFLSFLIFKWWENVWSFFAKNPTKVVILFPSGRTKKILFNNVKHLTTIETAKNERRVFDQNCAITIGRITHYFYKADSLTPINFDDLKAQMSPEAFKDLAILIELAGANNFLPLLIKQITAAITPLLVISMILIIISLIMQGLQISTLGVVAKGVALCNNTVSNVVQTTLVG